MTIYRETLESNANSSAASPYTFSPLFSLSISNPPSYRPMSSPDCVAFFAGDGGVCALCDFVSPVVTVFVEVRCRKDEVEAFIFDAGKGFGAANLERSFVTFV